MRTNALKILAVVLLTAVLSSGCASMCALEMRGRDTYLRVAFSDNDIRLIRNYYAASPKSKKTPPGLAKKKTLPPGLQKRIARGEPLPPGLQGRGLPCDLERQLTILPGGYIRLKIDRDIIIKDKSTGVVVDAIFDVD